MPMPKNLFTLHQPLNNLLQKILYSVITVAALLLLSACGGGGGGGGSSSSDSNNNQNNPPVLTVASNPLVFNVGVASTSTIAGSGGAPTSCSVNGLPAGLSTSVAGNGCVISGIATTASAPSSYTLTAINNDGTATTTFALHVTHPPALTTPSNTLVFAVGVASTSTIAGSGSAPTSCSANGLPAGLSTSVAGNGCAISGIATTASAPSSYTLTATNQDGTATTTVALRVIHSPALTTPSNTFVFGVGVASTSSIAGSGGALTSCSIADLPTGLTTTFLGNGCVISGIATTASAQSDYTLIAANQDGSSTITISLSVVNSPVLIQPDTLIFQINVTNSITIMGRGSTPTTCSIDGLPAGLTASVAGNGCAISGIATTASAQSSYTLTAVNNDGTATITIALSVIHPPTLTAPSSPLLFATDITVSRTIVTSGTPDSCSVAGLPAGLTATVSGDGCVITGSGTTITALSTHTLTATNAVGTDSITISIAIKPTVDHDANGLIELYTLTQLHNMRYSLDGSRYKTSSTDTGNPLGCPNDACIGYELMNDLDFDTDGDGTWEQDSSGNYNVDADDHAAPYFVVTTSGTEQAGGWLPVGDSANAFNTIFEGNGYVISNVAIRGELNNIGLFGATTANASIRNIGLVNNLSDFTGSSSAAVHIGGLVGIQSGGSISASYATGNADGGDGNNDYVGGLVGWQSGSITGSYATGNADGGDGNSDRVGGLVAFQNGGSSISASYATGNADGGDGIQDAVGGLVAFQNGSITGSYATGNADGGAGNTDTVGGLVAFQNGGSITASYATGNADGGDGVGDTVGGLVGLQQGGGSISASYSFGSAIGEVAGSDGTPMPTGVTSAAGLTAANVGSSWNSANDGTLGAWDFGDSSQPPALVFNDYDGDSTGTDYAALFGKVTKLGALLPNQRLETSPQIGTATTDIQLSSGDTANRISGNIQLPATFNGENLTWSVFYDPAPSSTQISVDNNNSVQITSTYRQITRIVILRARDGSNNTIVNDYHLRIIALNPPALTAPSSPLLFATGTTISRTIVGSDGMPDSCSIAGLPAGLTTTVSGDGCVITGSGTTITALSTYTLTATNPIGTDSITISIAIKPTVDRNNNGLIELYTLTQLHNMRYSLDGSRYKTSSTDTGNPLGCPNETCIGYELMNDLDFDTDGDGTWEEVSSGNYNVDADDHAAPYFVVTTSGTEHAGGWLPVGDSANAFNTIFEGNGYAIHNLAIKGDIFNMGLFGATTANANIRNIGLVNNLSDFTGVYPIVLVPSCRYSNTLAV